MSQVLEGQLKGLLLFLCAAVVFCSCLCLWLYRLECPENRARRATAAPEPSAEQDTTQCNNPRAQAGTEQDAPQALNMDVAA